MHRHVTRLEELHQEKEGLLCRLRQLQQEKERLLNRCQALQNCQPNQPTSSRLEVLCVNNKWKPYEEAICAEIARAQKAGEATCKIDLWGCSYGVDLDRMIQRNMETDKERKIRKISSPNITKDNGDSR